MKYCVKCKKELKKKKCDCGSLRTISGESIVIKNNKIVCECGETQFNKAIHVDYEEKYVDSGKCIGCNANVSIESYREKEWL